MLPENASAQTMFGMSIIRSMPPSPRPKSNEFETMIVSINSTSENIESDPRNAHIPDITSLLLANTEYDEMEPNRNASNAKTK